MSQKPRKTGSVADNVKVTIPFGGFDPSRLITDPSADQAQYPGLPLDSYVPTSRAPAPGLPMRPGSQLAAQPPRAGVMGVMGAPAAGMAGLLRSLSEQPGDLKAGLKSAASELGKAPFQEQPLTPSQVLRDRGIDVGAVPSMALDMFLDPTNLIGGDPTDIAKAAVAGGPRVAKAASRLYSRVAEEVLPRLSKSQHPNKVRSVLKSFASADEVAETGLEAFLQSKGDKPVTLEELEGFVKENPFSIRETHLGTVKETTDSARAVKIERQIAPVTVWLEDLDEHDSARIIIDEMMQNPGVDDPADLYMGSDQDAARPVAIDGGGRGGARKWPDGTPVTPEQHDQLQPVYLPANVARIAPEARTVGEFSRAYVNLLNERDVIQFADSGSIFAGPPKYDRNNLTLPGEKRDYRETLLQLPERPRPTDADVARYEAIAKQGIEKTGKGFSESRNGQLWLESGALSEDELKEFFAIRNKVNTETSGTRFQEPHFPGDPGKDAFLHIRHDVRTVDGADALHIEEVQSTWDQKASERVQEAKETIRKYEASKAKGDDPHQFRGYNEEDVKRARAVIKHSGYKLPAKEREALMAKSAKLHDEFVDAVNAFVAADPNYAYAKDWGPTYKYDIVEGVLRSGTLEGRELEAAQKIKAMSDEGREYESLVNSDIALTPHQPFRGTKATEVGVKRMLLEAADRGIDQVTWTTGRQQAQRYNNLLTDIKRVEWKPETGQLVLANAEDAWRQGRTIDGVTEKTLKDYIGKENADRLLASKAKPPVPKYEVKTLAEVRPVRATELTQRQVNNWLGTYDNMDDFLEITPIYADASPAALSAEATGDRPKYKVKEGYVIEPGSHSHTQEYVEFWNSNRFEGDEGVDYGPTKRVYKTKADAEAAVLARQAKLPEKYLLDTSDAPLEVGSRGMDQQYDEVMVAQFNKLGKAYGAKAEKVPLSGMASLDQKAFVIEEGESGSRRSVYYVNTDDVPEWAREAADEMFSGTEFKSEARAEEAVQDFIDSLSNEDGREYINANVKDTDYVWRFKIPEKMREALLTKGLPLMALAPLAAGLRDEKP